MRKKERLLFWRPYKPQELSHAITLLGASFIKLAQVLATRSDFFDTHYMQALKGLHDDLPPMGHDAFERVFARAFGVSSPFARFESKPIASASIGQVHEAWLLDGTRVAVKLRREGIERRVRADMRIVGLFNLLFRPLFSHYTKHSIEGLLREFSAMILQEVSLNQERANLIKFSRTYADAGVRFPTPFEALSCDDALVMSFEEGVRFDDKAALERQGVDIMALIDTLVRFYTEQMLVRGYFHADPHPGNLLVSPQGQLILLDFGMVKRVSSDLRVAIIELLQAANERDFERYVSASKRMGTVAYEAPSGELAEFTERMFEIFDNDHLSSGSMQQLAFEVMEQTRNLPFKLPQEAIYILRVSAIIEGLGTTYVENFNGIKDILPILQRNIPRALGAKESLLETIIDEFKALPTDIKALRTTLRRASEGSLEVELSRLQLSWLQKLIFERSAPVVGGFALMAWGLFLLLFDPSLREWALGLMIVGTLRLYYR
ncbi:MAG: AarF/ABC1/UbiB kinase family protein [Campylobacterales bacterium]|nr:AarF/ABC1/UbiB kinase family protein [Campylobacterales bacterium]